eukprot:TRINITY_DN5906_c0_g1_i1.p1 TRINITY_DN5906_c0_g1~~TRINITY_DN5906_c0_g1_i1.p1  ORF type:complete len:168 (-),score=16.37 TRINITY_DN5906_c0_g1_i1:69-572(-)
MSSNTSYLQIEFKTPYVVHRNRVVGRKRKSEVLDTNVQRDGDNVDYNVDCNNSNGERLEDYKIDSNPGKRNKKKSRIRETKVGLMCTHCGKTSSPEWRKGPLGRNTLCNACGLYYAKNIKRQEQCKDKQSLLQLDYILQPQDREVTTNDVLCLLHSGQSSSSFSYTM